MSNSNYYQKQYLKYKNKYIQLKNNMTGGTMEEILQLAGEKVIVIIGEVHAEKMMLKNTKIVFLNKIVS